MITDFDRTLTTHRVDGEERPSLISVLRSQNILSDEYTQAAYTLFDHFHPIEIDSSKSIHERSEQMETWWKAHLDLLTGNMTYDRLCELTGVTLADSHDNHHISVSLRQEHIIQAINSGIIRLRSGIGKFLSFSERNHIPFVIFSANVL